MGDRKEIHDGFLIGDDGESHNVRVAFGRDGNTFIADQPSEPQEDAEFWGAHNHYRDYDGGGTTRGHYTGPGA